MTQTTMPPVPVATSRLLHRLSAAQQRRSAHDGSAKDYAIEFGRYLANAAEAFMAEQNRAAEAAETPDPDKWQALQSAIYEFRKRAARAEATHAG